MKALFAFLFAAACLCLLPGCREEKKPAPANASSGNAVADYVNALGKAQQSAQKTLAGVGLDQGIKVFYTQEGRFPTNLDELVSKGAISQVPPPPRGMKYNYDPKSGGIKIVPE